MNGVGAHLKRSERKGDACNAEALLPRSPGKDPAPSLVPSEESISQPATFPVQEALRSLPGDRGIGSTAGALHGHGEKVIYDKAGDMAGRRERPISPQLGCITKAV